MFRKVKHLRLKEENKEYCMESRNFNIGSLVYSGSVKDIFTFEDNSNSLVFLFSDRYSVFDWGEMPDLLEKKGDSLAHMGKIFFNYLGSTKSWKNWNLPQNVLENLGSDAQDVLEELREKGVNHHCQGAVDKKNNSLLVSKVNVPSLPFIDGVYQYDHYTQKVENTLVPLEVIFRFGVPAGASILKRVNDESYLSELGLRTKPKEGDRFECPLIEFSTKLENTDRYLGKEEAKTISGMTNQEFKDLHILTTIVACRLRDFFKSLGITLWDGKFEWSFSKIYNGKRGLLMVDSIGPDELRLEAFGQKLSKEFLRSFYRDSEWLQAVEKGKLIATERNDNDWKRIVTDELKVQPGPLEKNYKSVANSLYLTLANACSKEMNLSIPFEGAMGLEELCMEMKNLEESRRLE